MISVRPATHFINKYLGAGTIGAEAGVYKGQHAIDLYRMLRPKKLYLVDCWDFPGDEVTIACTESDYLMAKNTLGSRPGIEWMMMTFEEAAKVIPDGSLDWVYIDGSHIYERVLSDIKTWTVKVRDKGVIAGHDINTEGVKKAIEKLGLKVDTEDNDWWYVKGDNNGNKLT